jgi:hypothetical protein
LKNHYFILKLQKSTSIASVACISGHGQPDPTALPKPARKWPSPSGQNMLSGWAWASFSGPIGVPGWAWVGKNMNLLKVQPDGPMNF